MHLAVPLFVARLLAQPGGFREQPVDDKSVIAAANFAVLARGQKDKKKLDLDKIVTAESQVVAGVNYRLLLSVRVDGGTRQATVVVWQKLDGTRELTRWKWMGEVVKMP